MARFKNTTLGSLSGSLGDITCRVRNNKTYVCTKPDIVKNPNTHAQKRSRSLLGFCSSLSAALVRINAYYSRWKDLFPESDNTKNNIHQGNYRFIKDGDDISDVMLVPEENPFSVGIIDIQFLPEEITVRTHPVPLPDVFGRRISVQGILQLQLPGDENLKMNRFIPFCSKDYDYESNIELIFNIRLSSIDLEIIKQYARKNLLINFALKNVQGVPERFSDSYYTIM